MFAKTRALFADQRGASAVEFAIVAPMLMTLIVGIFAVGWAMNCMSSLRLAMQVSARALELNQSLSASALNSIAQAKLTAIGDPNVVTVSLATDAAVAGISMKKITGSYVVQIKIPMLPDTNFTFTSTVDVPLTVS